MPWSQDLKIQAGGFRHRFSGSDWRLRIISWLDNFRCTRSHIIYGDQALFVRKSLFERLGGFPDQPILEDMAFCEKLLRVTMPVPVLLTPPVVTDARKFLRCGCLAQFHGACCSSSCMWSLDFPYLPQAFFQDIR